METNEKMNVLVLGNSGAGKSTLIKAISGTEILTGVGEGNTQKIDAYDSTTWPIRLIDTKGFEYQLLEQWRTIYQVKKFTKEQVKAEGDENRGIDAVWYCVEGTSRRMFSHNIELMNKTLKGWKNVPVFAVITKSYSEPDEKENIEAISQAFAKNKSVKLQKIIPVVAEEYRINDDIAVEPKGVDELCAATIDCSGIAKEINKANIERMILEQKRYTANALIAGATVSAAVVGATPFPFADSFILVPLETSLVKGIFKIYGVEFTGELITGIVGSSVITNVAKLLISSLKAIPIAGEILNAVIAGIFVVALGEATVALTESIHLGKIDQTQIDSVVEFMRDKLTGNALIGAAVSYLENNVDNIKGKKAKDIINDIQKSIKK